MQCGPGKAVQAIYYGRANQQVANWLSQGDDRRAELENDLVSVFNCDLRGHERGVHSLL